MLVRNVTEAQLREAAESIGVELFELRSGMNANSYRFRIVPIKGSDRYRKMKENPWRGGRRRVHAVCFHGHLEFFRNLFEANPNVKIRTAKHNWNSLDQLEAEKWEVARQNDGSQMFPASYGEQCDC